MSKVAFIAGATGAAAKRLVEELTRRNWRVLGASRNPPAPDAPLTHIPADLMDASGLARALAPHRDITHLFYAARATHAESGFEPVEENVAMLRNVLDAVEEVSPALEHVHLAEGTKWYGMHLAHYRTPAREDHPRLALPNFYYDQQDLIAARQKGRRWTWSASRPGYLADFAPERSRNIVAVVGAYAAICRELSGVLDFPGTETCWNAVSEVTDASQLARAMLFLSTSPQARNEAFNVTNGDLYRWNQLWPRIARLFDMPCGEVRTLQLAQWMADKEPVWQRIVTAHALKPRRLDQVALWSFGDFVFRQSCDQIAIMSKIRAAGFHDMVDTEEMYLAMLQQYRDARILP